MTVARQRRPQRRRERGSTTIVVAVGGVALMAATGLAIDGGMAAGAYRHAQNAADAGALAAARREYTDIMSNPAIASTNSELSGVSQTEVQHNSAQQTAFSTVGLGLPSDSAATAVYVASSTGGVSAQSALANIATTVSPGPLLPSVDATLTVNSAQNSLGVAPTSGSSWHGSWASAMTYLGYANSQALNESGYITCSSESATYGSPGSAQSCPPGTLPPQVSAVGTLVTTQNPDAQVSSSNVPSSSPSMTVLSESANAGAVSLTSNLVQSSNDLFWDPNTGMTSLAGMSATNVHLATSMVNVDASSLNFSVKVDYDPTSGHPVITPYCATQTITVTPQGGTATTLPIDSDCQPAGTIPSLAPGVTVTMPYESPAGLDYSKACTFNSSTGGWSCPQIQACLVQVTISTNSTTVCLGEASLSFSVTPLTVCTTPSDGGGDGGSSNGTLPQFLCEVKVTATVPQPTYFMRVLGWSQTSPTASATAGIESVVDVSDSVFAASPFGMPSDATSKTGSFGPLALGSEYYLYGPNMQTESPVARFPSSWTGELGSDSGHRVDGHVTASTDTTRSPKLYAGSGYYLEPVYDPGSLEVIYYGVFKPDTSNPPWATLVNSVPSKGGILVQATSVPGWTVLNQGALSIKLVQ